MADTSKYVPNKNPPFMNPFTLIYSPFSNSHQGIPHSMTWTQFIAYWELKEDLNDYQKNCQPESIIYSINYLNSQPRRIELICVKLLKPVEDSRTDYRVSSLLRLCVRSTLKNLNIYWPHPRRATGVEWDDMSPCRNSPSFDEGGEIFELELTPERSVTMFEEKSDLLRQLEISLFMIFRIPSSPSIQW